jgi:hypothetical protein
MKSKLLNWLLKDEKMRKLALREVVGDKEVKTVIIKDSSDVNIENCYLIHSDVSHNRNVSIVNNVMEYCMITDIYNERDVKLLETNYHKA